MSCRFPGANSPAELWRLARSAAEVIGEIPPGRWDRELLHDPDPQARGRIHTWRGGFLDEIDRCDWRALRLLPREARQMDPQHRLMLELAWEAFEDAGIPFEAAARGRTGVFVGLEWNDFRRLLGRDWSRLDGYSLLGNSQMFAANRISFAFDLRGPSLALDCGCASGLAALQLACQNLWLGECDTALVGGVELILSPDGSIAVEATGMMSRSGHCRPLDAAADGFVRSEGAGALVLKPLSSLSPWERPYALIRGLAVNHNGRNEWIMAASLEAQKEVLREACGRAGLSPADLDYVELHGTGHPRGDGVEARALAETRAGAARPCYVGAAKEILGHTGRASGIAALVKTALSLYHREVPPMRGPGREHPEIPLAEWGLAAPREVLAWPETGAPPRAGVTALSLGGVNAHAVLEALPERPSAPAEDGRLRLLPLSARCRPALAELARRWIDLLDAAARGERPLALADACFSAANGRSHHEHRWAVVGASAAEMARALAAVLEAGEPAEPATDGAGERGRIEVLARLYRAGGEIDWQAAGCGEGRLTTIPSYPWQRVRSWPEWLDPRTISTAPELSTSQGAVAPPVEAPETPAAARLRAADLAGMPEAEREGALTAYVEAQLRRLLRLDDGVPGLAALSPVALGLDSLTAHELKLRLEADLQVEAPLSQLLLSPSVAALARQLLDACAPSAAAGEPAPDPAGPPAPFPLTDLQQAYWIGRADSLELGRVGCHYYQEFESSGLDLARLEEAFGRLVFHHDALRTVVQPDGLQRVLPQAPPYRFTVLDLTGMEREAGERALGALRERLAQQVFEPDLWPLFEVAATRMGDGRLRLHLSFDLLMVDAPSLARLILDWGALYQDSAALPPLGSSFREMVLAELAERSGERYRRALDYWDARLADLPPAPPLPARRGAAAVTRSSRRRRRAAILAADRWERLRARGARRGLTSSVLLAAAFAEVLGAWSGDRGDRFTLNVTFNRRAPRHPDVELLLGDFTTTILLEVDRRPPGFEARARRLLERFTADLDHAAVSGVEVLRRRQRQRQESAVAAMPVVFTSLLGRREGRGEVLFSSNWLGEPVYGLSQTPQVSLDNMVYECEDGLGVVWDALEEAYPDGVLDAMFAAYIGWLERLAAPEEEAAWTAPRLDWVPSAQRASREEVNATAACLPVDLLHSGFERQARLRPEAVAVEAPGRRLSYGELDRLSALLAAALRRRGAAPNRLVAVVMEKGWEQAVAVLGILRAGAAYLPIGAELPASRVHELLARGEVALAVTQARVDAALDWPAGVTRLCVEDLAEPEEEGGAAPPVPPAARPDDLAYVIFTSGSTGRPKGVMISHRAALNTVLDVNRRFDVGPGDRLLALSSLSFDLSVWDLFGLFAAGGAVVFPAAGTERDPEHWAERMAAAGVTLWDSVPALLRMQVEHAAGRTSFPDLRLVLLSGDWIPVTLPEEVRRAAPGARVISLGGATEASIWSILWPADQVDPAWPSLPYGKPMAGQTFEVLSPGLSPCPDWVTGELAIGGAGVAMGYWGDAVETASRFVPDPAAREAGGRMFLTGDLGRWMGDGNLEILGREDFQVKIQGYRVELGEIEAALRQCPGVLDAVAVALAEGSDPRGQKRLVAYVVPEDGTMPPEPMLREFLAERLPPLMVPAAYLPLPALPLSSNGKVDRSRLPPPVFSALAAGSAGRDGEAGGPRDEVERLLVAAVEEILARSGVRPGDRFVDLGCTSVNMVQIHRRLRGRVPREISVPQMFRHPTVRALAEALRGERETAPEALEAGRAILGRAEVARRRLLARDGVS